jgi:hypothetical protein
MSAEKNSRKPWVSNYPPLKAWLDKIDARCIDQIPVNGPIEPTAYLEKWGTPTGRMFIVEVRANRMGWNIFTATENGTIAATLEDAEQRLGM